MRTAMCLLMMYCAIATAAIDNLARNGDFEDGLRDWEIRQSEGTVAMMDEDGDDSVKGGASVFVEIDLAKGVTWHLALFQDNHFLDRREHGLHGGVLGEGGAAASSRLLHGAEGSSVDFVRSEDHEPHGGVGGVLVGVDTGPRYPLCMAALRHGSDRDGLLGGQRAVL